jgi:hypothetical protein
LPFSLGPLLSQKEGYYLPYCLRDSAIPPPIGINYVVAASLLPKAPRDGIDKIEQTLTSDAFATATCCEPEVSCGTSQNGPLTADASMILDLNPQALKYDVFRVGLVVG